MWDWGWKRSGIREGHFLKAGLFTPSGSVTVYNGKTSQRALQRPGAWKHFSFNSTHQTRKWERETKPFFLFFSVSLLHNPSSLNTLLWWSPPESPIFAHVKCMKSMAWAAAGNGCYMWWIIPHLEDVAFGEWRLSWSQELCALSFAAGAEWWGGNLLAVKIGRVY